MGREQKDIYIFLSDSTGKFYRAIQQADGSYAITKNAQPYPIRHNPSNLIGSQMEFATNETYFSLARSINYPLDFIKDGAAILRHFYYLKKGIEEKVYIRVVEWNGAKSPGRYELSYYAKIDFNQKKDDPKTGTFTVSCIDDSAWGVLSQRDDVEYAVECNATNPKAIRVLFDSITLVNKYTFQTVQAPMIHSETNTIKTVPFVLVNQDGDSAGIATKNQSFDTFANPTALQASPAWFFYTAYAINGVRITGSVMFTWGTAAADGNSGSFELFLRTSTGQEYLLFSTTRPSALVYVSKRLEKGKTYSFDFDATFNLAVAESIFFGAYMADNISRLFTVTPIVTNIAVQTKTTAESVIAYGLRPLDFIRDIVSQATENRFSIDSEYFTVNDNDIILSGDSIRGVSNAKIFSSFKDFFQSFNPLKYMALRMPNGNLEIEKAIEVYKDSGIPLIDLGDIIDLQLEPATNKYANEVKVGAETIDLRHPSGRLEFNVTNTFSLPIYSTKNKLELVSKYRTGCYDIQFLILDYQGNSTQDNSGDKSVYLAEITDELGTGLDAIETFENITIDNAILEPIIKSPLDNDVITNDLPVVKGIAPPASPVNIYVDGVLDGGTVADADGNYSYQIVNPLSSYDPGITTGIHVIQATFTDDSAPMSTITIIVDTTVTTTEQITSINQGDSLYNNLPLIKGVAQAGSTVNLFIDGVIRAVLTADNSCKWEYKVVTPLSNGTHTMYLNALVDQTTFTVNSNVDYPLFTYIGSELDGFVILNNLPLIQGVARPGTIVTVYLNYSTYANLGVAVADANGNWSLQVVPVTYPDPVTGTPVVIAPIQNGLNTISTQLINKIVYISVTGYKLNRPNFSSITGVTDNTVFNTSYSPKRMLINHFPELAPMVYQNQNSLIKFQTEGKNSKLSTTLNGITISESADVPSYSLGSPLFLPEYAIIKTKTLRTFSKALEDFNNGGIIKATFRGTDIYMLPIGGMKMESITSNIQEWRLLLSPLTTYQSLLNLYRQGLNITIMKSALYHSDYNTLHMVAYNFQDNPKYNFKGIYQDWHTNRNDAWLTDPFYIQKVQKNDPIIDQIIVNGLSNVRLKLYRCSDAFEMADLPYAGISNSPLNPPEVILEVSLDMSLYPEDQYFTVIFVDGVEVAISERFETKVKWHGTILIESYHSFNLTGAFFTTGFKTILRVEGLVKKLQPDTVTVVGVQEDGDKDLLYGNSSKKRTIRFGTAYGLPDYLYLKMALAATMDNFKVEGVNYVMLPDEVITPSEDVEGHPLYYYDLNVAVAQNSKGVTFGIGEDAVTGTVILVVDATAVGLPSGSLINIEIDNNP